MRNQGVNEMIRNSESNKGQFEKNKVGSRASNILMGVFRDRACSMQRDQFVWKQPKF